jgi:peptidoglycan/xylan/chitin deacetylase (PgdA/CDA1 family)
MSRENVRRTASSSGPARERRLMSRLGPLGSAIDYCSNRATRYWSPKTLPVRGGPMVSFTFDDAPESASTAGAALLEARGVRGTFYIAGGLCGSRDAQRRLLTAAQCLALHRRGHEIACHTFSHPKVSALDEDDLRGELDRNREFFAELDPSIELENFAYPYNHASLSAKALLQRRFSSCRGGVRGINAGAADLGLLKGVEIDREATSDHVRDWIDKAVVVGGWLVFFTHDVSADPTPFGCAPEVLEAAVRRARERGCVVLPVRDALRRLRLAPPIAAEARARASRRAVS